MKSAAGENLLRDYLPVYLNFGYFPKFMPRVHGLPRVDVKNINRQNRGSHFATFLNSTIPGFCQVEIHVYTACVHVYMK